MPRCRRATPAHLQYSHCVGLLPKLPLTMELLIFVASAVTIWVAGISLSSYTDILSNRRHLGEALGGLILLAVATNLPEIAITYSAAASGQLDVAVSNILGGIAIQTVVLVALDAFGVIERGPLTYQAASLVLAIEGAAVLAVLVVVVMGTHLPKTLVYARLTPQVVLIAAVWVVGLVPTRSRLTRRLREKVATGIASGNRAVSEVAAEYGHRVGERPQGPDCRGGEVATRAGTDPGARDRRDEGPVGALGGSWGHTDKNSPEAYLAC